MNRYAPNTRLWVLTADWIASDGAGAWFVDVALLLLVVAAVVCGGLAIIENRRRMTAIMKEYCNTIKIDKK